MDGGEGERREVVVQNEKKGKIRRKNSVDEMDIAVAVDTERGRRRQIAKRKSVDNIWRQHAVFVILLDVAICSIMFLIWLTICRGFECIR